MEKNTESVTTNCTTKTNAVKAIKWTPELEAADLFAQLDTDRKIRALQFLDFLAKHKPESKNPERASKLQNICLFICLFCSTGSVLITFLRSL